MATNLDITTLELNVKEPSSIGEFIVQEVLQQPAIANVHRVWDGIKMGQKIYFSEGMGKTGIADASCTRPTSGAKGVITEKEVYPKPIGDTFINCQAEMDSLFKMYFDKITSYGQRFDITGSEEEKLIIAMIEDSLSKSILRHAWFGDKTVAAATSSLSGLKALGDAKYYNVIDGFWKHIFTAVTATDVARVSITENTGVTLAAQTTLAAGRSVAIFDAMWGAATPRLKSDLTAQLLVSGNIFENYRQYLVSKGIVYDINVMQNGLRSLKWNNLEVVDMSTVWDIDLYADFVDNTTNNAGYLPTRAILTNPDTIPVFTLNTTDLTNIESWYEKKERQNYTSYGYTLDVMLGANAKIVVAY